MGTAISAGDLGKTRPAVGAKPLNSEDAVMEGDNIGGLAEKMQKLIDVEVGPAGGFHEINDPVEEKLDHTEKEYAGNGPDDAGVDQGVGGETVKPEATHWVAAETRPVLRMAMVFAKSEELTLERVVGDRMANQEGETEHPPRLTLCKGQKCGDHFWEIDCRAEVNS
jgi:hypothetical protein